MRQLARCENSNSHGYHDWAEEAEFRDTLFACPGVAACSDSRPHEAHSWPVLVLATEAPTREQTTARPPVNAGYGTWPVIAHVEKRVAECEGVPAPSDVDPGFSGAGGSEDIRALLSSPSPAVTVRSGDALAVFVDGDTSQAELGQLNVALAKVAERMPGVGVFYVAVTNLRGIAAYQSPETWDVPGVWTSEEDAASMLSSVRDALTRAADRVTGLRQKPRPCKNKRPHLAHYHRDATGPCVCEGVRG